MDRRCRRKRSSPAARNRQSRQRNSRRIKTRSKKESSRRFRNRRCGHSGTSPPKSRSSPKAGSANLVKRLSRRPGFKSRRSPLHSSIRCSNSLRRRCRQTSRASPSTQRSRSPSKRHRLEKETPKRRGISKPRPRRNPPQPGNHASRAPIRTSKTKRAPGHARERPSTPASLPASCELQIPPEATITRGPQKPNRRVDLSLRSAHVFDFKRASRS